MKKVFLLGLILTVLLTSCCSTQKVSESSSIKEDKTVTFKTETVTAPTLKGQFLIKTICEPAAEPLTDLPRPTPPTPKAKDFDYVAQVGEFIVKTGIKENNFYFEYEKPKDTISQNNDRNEINNRDSNNTKIVTKIVYKVPKWAWYCLIFTILVIAYAVFKAYLYFTAKTNPLAGLLTRIKNLLKL